MRETSRAVSPGNTTWPPAPTRTHGTSVGTGTPGAARTRIALEGSEHTRAPANVTASRARSQSREVRPMRATDPPANSVFVSISQRCARERAGVYRRTCPCGQRRHEMPPCA